MIHFVWNLTFFYSWTLKHTVMLYYDYILAAFCYLHMQMAWMSFSAIQFCDHSFSIDIFQGLKVIKALVLLWTVVPVHFILNFLWENAIPYKSPESWNYKKGQLGFFKEGLMLLLNIFYINDAFIKAILKPEKSNIGRKTWMRICKLYIFVIRKSFCAQIWCFRNWS